MHNSKSYILTLAAALATMPFATFADGGPSASVELKGGRAELAAFAGEDVFMNDAWRFSLGDDKTWAARDFDDSAWRELDLPHDFQFELPWDKNKRPSLAFKPLGTGWYRKNFTVPPAWRGKRVFVEFEGLMAVGDIYLNGKKVGGTEYGYLGAVCELTNELDWDGRNVLAVRADAGHKGGSRWYTGAGITRDVHLIAKSAISVSRNGLYVKSRPEGTVGVVEAEVELDGYTGLGRDNTLEIVLEITAPGGRTVGRASAAAPWSKAAHQSVALPAVEIANVELWDIDSPSLYTATATLFLNGTMVDKVSEKFGVRAIEFHKDFGFKLNGRKVWLQGMSNHADLGALGAAVYDRAIERQFRTMKKFGYNAVRCSHNPYSKSFLRLADEMGILVVDELIDKWSGGSSYWNGRKPFMQVWPELVTEWIRRDRNHPSVILWSLGNETQMREDLCGFQTGDWGVTTYRIFDAMVKRWDSTRPTTVAMFPARAGGVTRKDRDFNLDPKPPELACITEVASFNYVYTDYPSYKRHAPHLNIFQSEASVRDLQRPIVSMDREHTVGLCYWGAIAYWGESDGWPKKGWCYSFFDRTLEPNATAYLVKSFFSPEPMVHIGTVKGKEEDSVVWNDIKVGRVNAAEDWNFPEGAKVTLYTYTNQDEVELLVNGKPVGVKRNNRANAAEANAIRWSDVPYESGEITAIARTGGKEVARHTIQTAGEAVRLEMVPENPATWRCGARDLEYVRVTAVDAAGRRVRSCRDAVKFSVSGPASILAVDDGDPYTDYLFRDVHEKLLFNGSLLVILRSGGECGRVTLSAECKTLPHATLELDTQSPASQSQY